MRPDRAEIGDLHRRLMVSFGEVAAAADLVARAVALATTGLAAVVALTHWAVRNRKIGAFGPWSRTVRSLSDPFLRPIERRLARRGGNPQDGSLWLLGITVVLGLLLMNAVRWGFDFGYTIAALAQASPRIWVRTIVSWIFSLLMVALFVRMLASWLGFTHQRWVRPLVWLTEWLLRPLRRIVPPMGPIDVSPIVGYLVLMILSALVDRILL